MNSGFTVFLHEIFSMGTVIYMLSGFDFALLYKKRRSERLGPLRDLFASGWYKAGTSYHKIKPTVL